MPNTPKLANLPQLSKIKDPLPLADLDTNTLMELQTALSRLGYPIGKIDGLYGPRTRNAWSEFKTDEFPGNPALIGADSIALIGQRLAALPSANATNLTTKDGTIAAIVDECKLQGIGLRQQIAYVLATAQWETAQTFKPVKEAFWLSESWRKTHLRYFPYYGRGYVQLTWDHNYKTYSDLLDIDLVGAPDLALQPKNALFILVHGFMVGTFTGRRIGDYVNVHDTDFIGARRCINGNDKAHEIASLADSFLSRL